VTWRNWWASVTSVFTSCSKQRWCARVAGGSTIFRADEARHDCRKFF
jgi:hypothetical protein